MGGSNTLAFQLLMNIICVPRYGVLGQILQAGAHVNMSSQRCRNFSECSGGSKGGGRRGRVAPLGVQILLISCSFWEILAKSYVGAPPLGRLAPPPRGNPGSATGMVVRHG